MVSSSDILKDQPEAFDSPVSPGATTLAEHLAQKLGWVNKLIAVHSRNRKGVGREAPIGHNESYLTGLRDAWQEIVDVSAVFDSVVEEKYTVVTSKEQLKKLFAEVARDYASGRQELEEVGGGVGPFLPRDGERVGCAGTRRGRPEIIRCSGACERHRRAGFWQHLSDCPVVDQPIDADVRRDSDQCRCCEEIETDEDGICEACHRCSLCGCECTVSVFIAAEEGNR